MADDRERKIYIEAKKQGKSDDFIRTAVLRDRQLRGQQAQPSVTAAAPQSNLSPVDRFIDSAQPIARGVTDLVGVTRLMQEAGGTLAGYAPQITPRETIGEGVQGIANVGLLGIPAAGTIIGRAGQIAAAGGLNRLGSGIENGEKAVPLAKGVAENAALAALLSVGLEKGTVLAKKALEKPAEGLYNLLVKTKPKEAEVGKELIGSGLYKRGIAGNYQKMSKDVQQRSEQFIKDQGEILSSNAKKKVDVTSVKKALGQYRAALRATPGAATSGVDRVLGSLKGKETIPLSRAQSLKQNLQAAVKEQGFLNDIEGVRGAQKVAARELRAAIEKAVPKIAPVNNELAFGMRATKRLGQLANMSPSKLRVIAEIGGLVGGAIGNPAIAAGVIGERLATSPGVALPVVKQLTQGKLDQKAVQTLLRMLAATAGKYTGAKK